MPYFTPAEARAQESALANETTYPDPLIAAMALAAEEALEHACGVAFISRTATAEPHDPPAGCDLILDWARPTAVSAVTVDGSALAAPALAAIVKYKDGRLYRREGWGVNRGGVLVTYTHGFAAVPGRVKRAAIQLTKRWLVDSPVNDRATQLVNPDGTTQWFVTAGIGGNITDIPEANAVISEYGVRGNVG